MWYNTIWNCFLHIFPHSLLFEATGAVGDWFIYFPRKTEDPVSLRLWAETGCVIGMGVGWGTMRRLGIDPHLLIFNSIDFWPPSVKIGGGKYRLWIPTPFFRTNIGFWPLFQLGGWLCDPSISWQIVRSLDGGYLGPVFIQPNCHALLTCRLDTDVAFWYV